MREITSFVGGSIGDDPYSPRTWSGACRFLLNALTRKDLLDKAVGLKLSSVRRAMLMARNFSPDRSVWRKHFYFDPAYRKALSQAAKSVKVESPYLLQMGAMFSLPAAFPGQKCFSYHDANLPQALASGFGFRGVSGRRIDQALRYEEDSAQGMTAVLTFSEYVRQSFISDFHLSPDKVFAIGAAVNLETLPPTNPDKDYLAKKILFIGIDFVRKGGPQLLKAFSILRETYPDSELHIVGPREIGELPAGVHLHGHLAKNDLAQKEQLEQLFRTSTLFVMPSLYEPFGIAPLEAMLYEMPCILTDAWAFREYITPGINGELIEKGSVEDLASKMKAMLSDPTALARMGSEARRTVLNRYTWNSVASRIEPLVRPVSQ